MGDLNSFKTLAETFRASALIPFLHFKPTLDSWKEVLSDPERATGAAEQLVVSLGTTLLVLILGMPAAYAWRATVPDQSNDIALWFLSQRVLPPAVVLIPFYLLLVICA